MKAHLLSILAFLAFAFFIYLNSVFEAWPIIVILIAVGAALIYGLIYSCIKDYLDTRKSRNRV